MAIREVRIHFELPCKQTVIEFNREFGNPFTFYMDAVMRGRFKSYSGPEVKGINIVNLFLYENTVAKAKESSIKALWAPLMNTYVGNVIFDFQRLSGSRSLRIETLIDVFSREAAKSNLPQMQMLVRHVEETKGKISIEDAINRGDAYLKALRERVERRALQNTAEQGAAANP
jgi:hypothetical protein